LKTSRPNTLLFAVRHWSLVQAMSFGSALAHIATSGMPLQVGALMDGTARTASQAGLFAFVQVTSLSVGMILISLSPARIRPFTVAVAGSLLAALGDIGLFFASDFQVQLLLGALAGLGFGFAYSATISAGASSDDPDRAYAVAAGGTLLLIVLIMTILPFTSARLGHLGVFACVAGFALICLPLFRGFKGAHGGRQARVRPAHPAVWRTAAAAGLLFSWAAFSSGTAVVYVFAERIGTSIHLPSTDVGLILSAGVFMGMLGAVLAAHFSQRLNRRGALTGGLVGSALACLLISHATTALLFAAGVFLFWIFTMFLYCCLLGTAAVLDESGRLGTLGSGTERLGYAVGAWIGGLVVQYVGYASTGTIACAACLLGVVVGYPALFRTLPRSSSAPAI